MSTAERIFYVYALLDPRKPGPFIYNRWKFPFQPFYVGKGKGRRATSHLNDHAYKPNKKKSRVIASIRRGGLEPIVMVKRRRLTEERSFEIERILISSIGRGVNGPLTNMTAGGQGLSGHHHHRQSTIRKISESNKKYFARMNERERKLYRKRMSKAAKAYNDLPEERKAQIRANMSEARRKYWASLSPEERAARGKKQIVGLLRSIGLSNVLSTR